jgi:predicted RNA binding protein YcfA (HicA-like mRNA interferase family)
LPIAAAVARDQEKSPARWYIVKVREVIRKLEADGWYLVATRGSHRQYKHPTKPGRVTIAGHSNDDLAPGTLTSVRKQAGWKEGAK